MIEIRDFEGDMEHLAEFVSKIWRQTYQGRMPVPYWSTDFLARDVWPNDETARHYNVAAYDGTRLVGTLPAWPGSVLLHGEERRCRIGSFASVDPEYRRQGVAKLMHERIMQHAKEHGYPLSFFFLYMRSREFRGTKFWRARGMPTQPIRKLGLWVRPWDHAAVARWELQRFEAWGTRLMTPFARRVSPPVDAQAIRPFRPEDLSACESLVRQRSDSMDLARRFDAQGLIRQLTYNDVAKTLVTEHEGRVAGLVNFCYLDIFGRSLERFGLIDLLAFDTKLPHSRRADLLRAVLHQMKQDGLIATTMLRGSWYAYRALRAVGFLPMFPEYCLIGVKHRDDVSLEKIRRILFLWR